MKILFTGASSFTGMWFVQELAKEGHEVICTFQYPLESYAGLRKERVEQVLPFCRPVYSCRFGSDPFLSLVESGGWDLFCHHAACVTEYRSPNFDYAAALESNTHRIRDVLSAFRHQGCNRILLTGSVFEQNEGNGSDGLRAVSPYGLSKGLTSDVFRYFCQTNRFKLGKFVIPNPFGPYEEGRFTSHLAHGWLKGDEVSVRSPEYVRDNIHVSLLAKAYAVFAASLTEDAGYEVCHPSGYRESQGSFTKRFAAEMEKRWNIPCRYSLCRQTEFSEPKERVNTEPLDPDYFSWNEDRAWDQLAAFYKEHG